jgi:hypothetical protein
MERYSQTRNRRVMKQLDLVRKLIVAQRGRMEGQQWNHEEDG